MSAIWETAGLTVEEAARALDVTPKTVNERVRRGFHEDWKAIDNRLADPASNGARVFVRGHGYKAGDQVEISGAGESLDARWRIDSADPHSFVLAGSGGLSFEPGQGGRVRRVLTIRTASYRRADLGRKMRLCHPDDIEAIRRLTGSPHHDPRPAAQGTPMSTVPDTERNAPAGGIFDDKPFYRIGKLPEYVFAVINEMRHKARVAGLDVIDLGMGNPDGATPKAVIQKLSEAARDKRNHRYSASKGIWRLREEICKRYKRKYDVDLDHETEAIVTIGAKDALAHLTFAVIGPDDPVVMPDPAYPIHQWGVVMADGQQWTLPLNSPEDFLERLHDLYRTRSRKPAMILVSFPHNPSTMCVDIGFFEELVALARRHGTMILHDFAYADLLFDGYEAPSILQVPGAKDVAVEIYSMSKSFNMAGWRVGFCLGNKKMIHALARIKSYLDYGNFQPIQIASIIALRECQEDTERICEVYRSRRDTLVDGLHKAGWMVEPPQATMFLWAKIPERYAWAGSLEFAKVMLEKALVAVSPGIGFGPGGEGYVRFSLIENEQRLRQATRGIKKLLAD